MSKDHNAKVAEHGGGEIDLIKGKIERNPTFKDQSKTKLKYFETNNHFIQGTKVQGSNEKRPRVKLKGFLKIRVNWGFNYKISKIKGKNQIQKSLTLIVLGLTKQQCFI